MADDAREDSRDALLVIMVLVRKLGGAVTVTADDLLAAADGVLRRIDVGDGFELGVAKREPGGPAGPRLEVWEGQDA